MAVAPIHGNYHGYYAKRPASQGDPRLALLPALLTNGARVLDVGCNDGTVTCEIAQNGRARRVVGVDIDPALVRLAWKNRRTAWSVQEPDVPEPRPHYFPAAFEHMFGPLPVPTSGEGFPHNLTFRAADWAAAGVPEDREGWDVVLMLSVTKWVHLNAGDAGLRALFLRARDTLRTGGTLVLEPQDWASYAKARRMHPTLRENAASLELRPDDFPRILTEMGFSGPERVGETGEGGFNRPVDLYVKLE